MESVNSGSRRRMTSHPVLSFFGIFDFLIFWVLSAEAFMLPVVASSGSVGGVDIMDIRSQEELMNKLRNTIGNFTAHVTESWSKTLPHVYAGLILGIGGVFVHNLPVGTFERAVAPKACQMQKPPALQHLDLQLIGS
jgi:hypothetical protein